MINAVGAPQSMLVIGATSDIARATVTQLASAGRLQRVVLAGRSGAALDAEVERVRRLGVPLVTSHHFEARDRAGHEQVVADAFDAGEIDVVLICFGVLPDEDRVRAEPLAAAEVVDINFTAVVTTLLASAKHQRAQGHGVIVVLSSAAAVRGRASNAVYGSTKAGVDALASGLGDALQSTGVSVVVVRPGFVRTRMTAGLRPAPLAVTPQDVAEAIAANLTLGSRTIWVPTSMGWVMGALAVTPRALFRRLPI
ncbi:decaprenylphospho-beta-D-erythro-pentofuranosid-2 -ulose 2-reductase [Terrabacter aerolatus]|uniref:Short-chain dehydrogenase n=1 Tax=Terrabacter aerolatus TaxID=422442 RepID=A0A512D4N4_9MICO|nr:SDR family NAD(P)-dependent oxidoreductase [Terrabacter aerolatus]GEO31417.1 short-chain dehydrogenase [Terrabacter aerolatus]